MRFGKLLISIAFLIGSLAAPWGSRAVAAEPEDTSLLVIDAAAAARTDRDVQVTITASTLVARARPSNLAVQTYAGSSSRFQEYSAGETGAIDHIQATLESAVYGASDQFRALSAAFEYLSSRDAPDGTRVTYITADGLAGQTAEAKERLVSFAGLFGKEGWTVDVVMLPSTAPESRETLVRIADATSGKSYDTGVIEGIASLMA
ncbi:MAG: hypothetical protein HY682_02660, partial [Chloroflexi bacterium]|nr:hypothetical protein [Chloroflexota bacterium]